MVTTRRAKAQRIGAHHYVLTDSHYILIEFADKLEAQLAIKHSTFEEATGLCVQSPFIWFRAAQTGCVAKDYKNVTDKLMITDGYRPIDYNYNNEIMLGAESLSHQIDILYRATTLNDLGIRMRFLAARQIEESVSSIFPSAKASIFGSSVNGYGKLGCDLDLVLQFHSLDCDVMK
ncbi:hypothetical protein HA402_011257 [Bradysia odoriphaga]|nr:hypothetical protein HA402_011257 [Bradysia odoriphaga]